MVVVECANGLGPHDLFTAAQSCGAQIRHFERARKRLEEIFVQAIGLGEEIK